MKVVSLVIRHPREVIYWKCTALSWIDFFVLHVAFVCLKNAPNSNSKACGGSLPDAAHLAGAPPSARYRGVTASSTTSGRRHNVHAGAKSTPGGRLFDLHPPLKVESRDSICEGVVVPIF